MWSWLLAAIIFLVASPAMAAEGATPDLEARVKDLEAYITNVAPPSGNLMPGPGHNGWMMVCAALVLFMTLPGLALFYGGLVRSKNVLSVMAQCLGLAGVVPLLWYLIGYSLCFAPGTPFVGGSKFAMLA